MNERLFTSGFCGITLIPGKSGGGLRRVTFREPSHRMCPVVIAGLACECSCHHDGAPWDEIGVGPERGERTVYDSKRLEVPAPTQERVSRSTAVSEPAAVVREKGTDIAAEMRRILDEMDDWGTDDSGTE